MIINDDSLHALKEVHEDSIDAVITDPPYGYSFMGKDWDKAVPSVDIWRECLRVLKPGGWCMVMSAPRSDVQNAMISRLMEAGFRLDFTPIYWTYASGFPKAGNVGKLVDKRLGNKHESTYKPNDLNQVYGNKLGGGVTDTTFDPKTAEAKALNGSYTGFQPKPAVEVIIVAMKPLSEKTYVDQALKNGKGITWLDDCRIPGSVPGGGNGEGRSGGILGKTVPNARPISVGHDDGRFPANLLVSDEALKGHSKYFDLDAWAEVNNVIKRKSNEDNSASSMESANEEQVMVRIYPQETAIEFNQASVTHPFAVFPKASKSEKNKGITGRNIHPTCKPLKLMSYLITLTTRPGDTVLDPFVGSGTTVVAAKQLGRKGIGIEREQEYAEIAAARVEALSATPEVITTNLYNYK